jgi:hypothetical protein
MRDAEQRAGAEVVCCASLNCSSQFGFADLRKLHSWQMLLFSDE